ncbi:MAG: V-type ATP synthase subunit E [Treponemataceae bacterium]|nr:V-type ATP synthase subunit E [Treponemataceae bacterium]
MDVQLQELIDKIKKDGVASAESAAADIIAAAEKKAQAIVADAEEKAAAAKKAAKAETERMEKASKDAIAQAGRNLLIQFREGVNAQLNAIINAECAKAYDADLLKKLIPETVKAWASNGDADSVAVLLSEKDLKALEDGLKSALKSEIAKGCEIKADPTLSNGFRISTDNGAAFYDFSAEAVADLFAAYLNPVTAAILKEAAAGVKEGN